MEKQEKEEFNSSEESDMPSNRESRSILNYDLKNVRNLNISEILTRMHAHRQHSESLGTALDASGPSTSTQDWTSIASPSTSRGINSPQPERRFTILPESSRQAMILSQLPAGCLRSSSASQEDSAGRNLHPLRTQFYEYSFADGGSTSRYDYQSQSSPVSPRSILSPRESRRKTSLPGHPFGLGSEKSSRSQFFRDFVPIEFIKSCAKKEPDIPNKKDKLGQPEKTDEPGKSGKKGGYGESYTEGIEAISTDSS